MKYARAVIHDDVVLLRREPGLYLTSDGKRAIVQTEFREGPRGGMVRRWELASVDHLASGRTELTIDSPWAHRTLRDAIAALREEFT